MWIYAQDAFKGATAHLRAAWFIFMQKNFRESCLPPTASSASTASSRADGVGHSLELQAPGGGDAGVDANDPGFGYGYGVSAGGADRVECIRNAAGECLCHLVRLAASGTEYLNVNLARLLAENNDALKHALYQLYVALASAARVPPAVPQWGSLANHVANHVVGLGGGGGPQQPSHPPGSCSWQHNPHAHAFGAVAAALPGAGFPFGHALHGALQTAPGGPAGPTVPHFIQPTLPLLLHRQIASLKAAAAAAPLLQKAQSAAPQLAFEQRDSLWSTLAFLQAARRNTIPENNHSSHCCDG